MYWDKIFSNYMSGKVLIVKIYKELSKLNNKKTIEVKKKWTKDLNRPVHHQDKHTNQCISIERPEINPCICGQSIFHRGAKIIQQGKNIFFNKWWWEYKVDSIQYVKEGT